MVTAHRIQGRCSGEYRLGQTMVKYSFDSNNICLIYDKNGFNLWCYLWDHVTPLASQPADMTHIVKIKMHITNNSIMKPRESY